MQQMKIVKRGTLFVTTEQCQLIMHLVIENVACAWDTFVPVRGRGDEEAAPTRTALSKGFSARARWKHQKPHYRNKIRSSGAEAGRSAAHSALPNTCDNGNSVLFCFSEHKSGMEVQHANGMKSHQQVLRKLSDSNPFGYQLAGKSRKGRKRRKSAVVCCGPNGR